eukprot:6918331-Prymnesium_polylepis.1
MILLPTVFTLPIVHAPATRKSFATMADAASIVSAEAQCRDRVGASATAFSPIDAWLGTCRSEDDLKANNLKETTSDCSKSGLETRVRM